MWPKVAVVFSALQSAGKRGLSQDLRVFVRDALNPRAFKGRCRGRDRVLWQDPRAVLRPGGCHILYREGGEVVQRLLPLPCYALGLQGRRQER